MLATLRVKNLALVENVHLDFQSGLNVITGETGAGKSILVGALNLLLGERADRRIVRAGEEACGAEAIFQLNETSAVNALLTEYGLSPCEDSQLIIRRIIKASGTSQNLVNDSPVTLQVLKQLGQLLVDLHGPHDHQSLLSPSFQIDLLDAYGHLEDERAAYRASYDQRRELDERVAALQGDDQDVEAQIDLLSFRVKEIEEAAPREGEEQEVEREHLLVTNSQRVLELGSGIGRAMLEGEASAFDALAAAQRNLEELARLLPEAETWRLEARAIASQLQELGATISRTLSDIETDPARLEWLEQRIGVYQKLRRKYGATIAEILNILSQSRERLRTLQTRGEQLAKLEAEIKKADAKQEKLGMVLRKRRKEAAVQLARAVTRELHELGFAHGSMDVELQEAEPRPDGLDVVEFGFAPNVGEPMRALREIASSGEISRVMLAAKAVLAQHDKIPVLVFDEIDANLGGEMATAVGRKLAELAEHRQLICITHLPQVAIFGQTHFAVSKQVRDQRTVTEVHLLGKDDRVEEVARMLGGRDMTGVTLQHAREMLQKT